LAIYSIPTRGFTAVVSVFRGTPPPKPLICKSVLNRFGALDRDPWAEPTGEEFCILCACFVLARSDIIKTSLFVIHSVWPFVVVGYLQFLGNKKPCLLEVSRVEKNYYAPSPAYPWTVQSYFGFMTAIPNRKSGIKHITLPDAAATRRFCDPCRRPNRGGYVRAGFHRKTLRLYQNTSYSQLIFSIFYLA